MKLRPYQLRCIADMARAAKRGRPFVVVSPTGSGKTVIAVSFLKKHAAGRVLWIAHRKELLEQAHNEMIASGIPARDVGIFTSKKKDNVAARILVTSVGMWTKRELPPGIKWVVIDEAHRSLAATYRAILAELPPGARVIGLTATPVRTNREPLGDVFEEMIVAATPTELILDGHVPKPRCFGIERGKATPITRELQSGGDGDWTAASAARSMRTMYGDIVAEVQRLARGLQTVVFAPTREYGKRLLKRFLRAGLTAEYLDGETETVLREAIIARLKSGATRVVINVDVLSEGFDCPPVKCIVLARPTRSLTRLLQQCGRGSRLYKGQRPIIIDSAGNFTRFPLPDFSHEWSLTDEGPRASAGGDGHNKTCHACGELIPVSCRECPECTVDQPLREREIQEQETKLVELRASEAELAKKEIVIRALAKARGLGSDWVRRALSDQQ